MVVSCARRVSSRECAERKPVVDEVLDILGPECEAGSLFDITLRVNWYLNPNVRVTFKYVWTDLENKVDVNIVPCRFQIEL